MYYQELKAAKDQLTGPGGPFEIIETEILGNRIRDFKNRPNSVRDIWLSTAQFADRTYIVYQDERISYGEAHRQVNSCLLYTSPSPRDMRRSRMPSSA